MINKKLSTGIQGFTATQKERYHSIFPIIGAAASDVIVNLKGRGRSSWKSVQSNILLVNNPKNVAETNYYNKLDQVIDLDETYTTDDCTQTVSEIRYETGMPAFQNKIENNCMEELFKLFMWEDVHEQPEEEGSKPVFIGYKPICRLKA